MPKQARTVGSVLAPATPKRVEANSPGVGQGNRDLPWSKSTAKASQQRAEGVNNLRLPFSVSSAPTTTPNGVEALSPGLRPGLYPG